MGCLENKQSSQISADDNDLAFYQLILIKFWRVLKIIGIED